MLSLLRRPASLPLLPMSFRPCLKLYGRVQSLVESFEAALVVFYRQAT